MKKLLVILLVMPLFAIYSMMVFGASPVTSVYIHYYRFAEDYTDWNVWVWQSEPVSLDGADTETQYFGDLSDRAAFCDHLKHFPLPVREGAIEVLLRDIPSLHAQIIFNNLA